MEAAATDIKGWKRFEVLRLANGRPERPNNRGLWRQTAGCNALTTEGYGGKRQAATLEQQRAMEAKGKLQRSNNKCLRPECLVEAAARDVEGFKRF